MSSAVRLQTYRAPLSSTVRSLAGCAVFLILGLVMMTSGDRVTMVIGALVLLFCLWLVADVVTDRLIVTAEGLVYIDHLRRQSISWAEIAYFGAGYGRGRRYSTLLIRRTDGSWLVTDFNTLSRTYPAGVADELTEWQRKLAPLPQSPPAQVDLSAAASSYAAPPGLASSGGDRRSYRRARWAVGVAVAVFLALGGLGVWHLTSTPRHGIVAIPSHLLGLDRYTGTNVDSLTLKANMEFRVQSDTGGLLPDAPVTAIYGSYGSPGGQWVAVVAGAITCSTSISRNGTEVCVIGTAAQVVRYERAHGYADARAFPPGPGGVILVCSSQVVQSARSVGCIWVSQATAGGTIFGNASAASLGDAAAKTRQIRAAIER